MALDIAFIKQRSPKKLNFYLRSICHTPTPKPLDLLAPPVLQDLKREGVSVTSLQQLAGQDTDQLLESAKQALRSLPEVSEFEFSSDQKSASSHRISVPGSKVLEYPSIYLWGLQERLLNIIEAYFHQPIAYLGCRLAMEVPNQKQTGLRLWHRDGEDYKVVKVILYLNDVDDSRGPFEYIPRQFSPTPKSFRQNGHLIRNAEMHRVTPMHLWQRCTGPQGTVIIADTTSVFHHASMPQQPRLTLNLGYVTAKPKNFALAKNFNNHWEPGLMAHYQSLMTPRQRQVAFDWRSGQ